MNSALASDRKAARPASDASSSEDPSRAPRPARSEGSERSAPDAAGAPGEDLLDPGAPGSRRSLPAPDRPAEHAIYKPNQRGSGGVFRFELNTAKAAVFVEAAAQSGEKRFDWQQKITMKWGQPDLGAMLATLRGRQAQAKLFHQSAKANSAFELVSRGDPQRAPYLMSLSRQESSDQSVRKVTIPLTHAEAAVLEVLIEAAVRRIQGW